MNYRRFGDTDMMFSELCFGPMRFEHNPKSGPNALDKSIDAGINVIHSSYEYKTIDQLGACLRKHPKKHDLHHIIKLPVPNFNEPTFVKEKFRTFVEDALKNLGTERIDVIQHLHRTVPKDIVYQEEGDPQRLKDFPHVIDELSEVFEQMKQEGKVGYLASFPMTPGYTDVAIESGKFDAIAAFYNLIETDMIPFFDRMHEKGMGFIAIRPILRGLITDRRQNRAALPEDDALKGSKWDDAYELFEKVQAIVPNLDMSWEAFGIKFCLSNPNVTTVVMGLNNAEQVDTAVKAADGNYLEMQQVQQILDTIEQNRKPRITWPPY